MAIDHTLILVHGMGKPDKNTFKEWEKKLAALHDTYASSDDDKFSKIFRCVHVNYDTVFEERRKQWYDQVDSILDNIKHLPAETPTKDDLAKVTADNFFTTHIMDVLLYRCLPLVAEHVRAVASKAILDGIQTQKNTGGKVSIIAYSLGTSVVHDAVNQLYRPDADGKKPLTTDQFRFHCIAQLANVSRTLATKWKVYEPYFRPGVFASPDQNFVATRMLSASHTWDPLVSLKRFKPEANWPDAETVAAKRFQLVEPSIIQHWNVHDLHHYLDDPHVHIPMFRFLRTKGFIKDGQATEAIKTFNEKAPIEKLDEYRSQLKALITGEADFSLKRLYDVFKGFSKLVGDAVK